MNFFIHFKKIAQICDLQIIVKNLSYFLSISPQITSKLRQPQHRFFLVFSILKKFTETYFNKLFYVIIWIRLSDVFTNYFCPLYKKNHKNHINHTSHRSDKLSTHLRAFTNASIHGVTSSLFLRSSG